MAPDRLLTLDEVSEWLQIPKSSLYDDRYHGRPPGNLGVKIGNRVRFRRSTVEAYLADLEQQLTNGGGRRGR